MTPETNCSQRQGTSFTTVAARRAVLHVGPVVGVEDADALGNRRRIALEILERLDCF